MEEIKEIQEEIKKLSHTQLDLLKAHQEKVKEYQLRVKSLEQKLKNQKQQQTLYQWFFGSFLYSQSLSQFGLKTPADQYSVYLSAAVGSFVLGRSYFRAYHVLKAAQYRQRSPERRFHRYLASASDNEIMDGKAFANRLWLRGTITGLLIPIVCTSYMTIAFA